jgi:Ca2+-binding EF-hand superfamily protein
LSSFGGWSDASDEGVAASQATHMSAWHHGEKTSAILPKIPYSARATRQASEPASRPKLTPGEKVGVYEVGKAGASASLATVVSVNDETNTVKVDLSNGEQRELPASALVDTKFMKLVNGTPKRRRKKKKKQEPVHLPKMDQRNQQEDSWEDFINLSEELDVDFASIDNSSRYASPRNESAFNHGTLCAAETFHEVHLLLNRPSARTAPPCDAKSFKNALSKKFFRLEYAWQEIDSNCDGCLDFTEFCRACRRIQFAGNLKKIFGELTKGEDTLHPECIDAGLPAKLQKMNMSPKKKFKNHSKEPAATTGPRFNHGRRTSAETLGEVHLLTQGGRRSCDEGEALPEADAKTLKQALIKKFRALDTAWNDMDTNSDGVVDFTEFIRACRGVHIGGNLKRLFKEMTDGEGVLRPEMLDASLPDDLGSTVLARTQAKPLKAASDKGSGTDYNHGRRCSAETLGEVHMLLSRPDARGAGPSDAKAFKHALRKKFGRLARAWVEIDENRNGLLEYHEFVRACRSIQFSGNLKKVFEDLTGGEKCLRPDLLDVNLPAELGSFRQ